MQNHSERLEQQYQITLLVEAGEDYVGRSPMPSISTLGHLIPGPNKSTWLALNT